MRTDGVFTLNKYVVNYTEGQSFTLRPFGDLHRDSPAFAKDKWAEFLEDSARTKNILFIGMGDYFDSFSSSERVIFSNDKIHESTKENIQKECDRKIVSLANELKFMKGKLIGLLCGNHYMQFSHGATSDTKLAEKLETDYLGVCAAIRIIFQNPKRGRACASIDIFAHHGKGAGQTATGRLASVEKMTQIAEADILLQGHNHARGALPLGDKLRIDSNNHGLFIRSRHAWIGRTGGFLRGYVNNEASYVTDALMVPTSLGWIDFTLTPRRIRDGGVDRIVIDIGSKQ